MIYDNDIAARLDELNKIPEYVAMENEVLHLRKLVSSQDRLVSFFRSEWIRIMSVATIFGVSAVLIALVMKYL